MPKLAYNNPTRRNDIVDATDGRLVHRFLRDLIRTDWSRTYNQVAREAGVSHGTVMNMARGVTQSCHLRTANRIASVYGYKTSIWR